MSQFDDNRVRPEGIVINPLGKHDVEMKPIVLLGEFRRGIDLGRIFQHLAAMDKALGITAGKRLNRADAHAR